MRACCLRVVKPPHSINRFHIFNSMRSIIKLTQCSCHMAWLNQTTFDRNSSSGKSISDVVWHRTFHIGDVHNRSVRRVEASILRVIITVGCPKRDRTCRALMRNMQNLCIINWCDSHITRSRVSPQLRLCCCITFHAGMPVKMIWCKIEPYRSASAKVFAVC